MRELSPATFSHVATTLPTGTTSFECILTDIHFQVVMFQFRPVALGRDTAALVPHSDGSGPTLLFQKVGGERLGGTQKIKATGCAIFGQGVGRGDEKFYFG